MKAIAVVDQNWGIGRDGKLLVHLPGDLRYFKERTLGKTIIMGRETFEGMSCKLLAGRETILLSKNPEYRANCKVCNSLEELFEHVKDKKSDDIFVAGGEAVYRQLLPFCDTALITKMYATFDSDRHFPNLDENGEEFRLVRNVGVMEENGIKYNFFEYRRRK